ncbi:MAG: hypothetical protein N2692_00105 [Patescibacteria group bacterium]|jgi:SAM-dependent methyltransferase|nr:hypothetical protein [Patescibacteria group bacterium]
MAINFLNKKVEREEYIIELCKNKRVLHLGCLGADRKATFHNKISKVAQVTYGLDIFDANLLNYIKANAEDFYTDEFFEFFDIIIIGELIEHVWNIGKLICNTLIHLKSGGKIIITTPNAYAPIFLKDAIFGKFVKNDKNHVLLFDIVTLQNLLNNYCGDKVEGYLFFYFENNNQSLAYKIQRLFECIKKEYCRGIIAELTKF